MDVNIIATAVPFCSFGCLTMCYHQKDKIFLRESYNNILRLPEVDFMTSGVVVHAYFFTPLCCVLAAS